MRQNHRRFRLDVWGWTTIAILLLYGLFQEDQEVVYAVYDAFHGDAQALIARADRLGRIADAALTKGRTCRRGEDF